MNAIGFALNGAVALEEASEWTRTIPLRAFAAGSRAAARAHLPCALAACGCGAPLLTETERTLVLHFDLPMESAFAVYSCLMEMGVDLSGPSHDELVRMCTVTAYLAEFLLPERPCTARLELRFRAERRSRRVCPAAGRA